MTGEYESQGFGSPNPFPIVKDPSIAGISIGVERFYDAANSAAAQESTLFRVFQDEHIGCSQDAITAAAGRALYRAPEGQPHRALILGAGNCTDIPLPEIIEAFDHTTVVDISIPTLKQLASTLPTDQADKISLVGADVTGVMVKLTGRFEQLSNQHSSYEGFAAAAVDAIEDSNPHERQPTFSAPYDFVCSHFLLSQLATMPAAYLYQGITEPRYSAPFPNDEEDPIGVHMRRAYNLLNQQIQVGHIDYLARLVARTGVVHFADTYAEITETNQFRPIVEQSVPARLSQHFKILAGRKEWRLRSEPLKEYAVLSDMLVPKDVRAPQEQLVIEAN